MTFERVNKGRGKLDRSLFPAKACLAGIQPLSRNSWQSSFWAEMTLRPHQPNMSA
jgi:hypothetical protein